MKRQTAQTVEFTVAVLCCLLAGACNGLHETLQHHYPAFAARFPAADAQYWNPAASWVNKYAGGDPSAGPAFPLSTSWLAFLTDAKHALSTAHIALLAYGMALGIGKANTWFFLKLPNTPRWVDALIVLAAVLAIRAVGFTLIYTLYFR